MPKSSPPGQLPWVPHAGSESAADLMPDRTSIQVEPSAIPKLVSALQNSLDSVGVQIEHAITELRIRPWAGDPVSITTAEQFNERFAGGDHDALSALYGYRDRLQSAVEALHAASLQYEQVDVDNADRFRIDY